MSLDQGEVRALQTVAGGGERIQPLLSQLQVLSGEADQLLVNVHPVNRVLPVSGLGWLARQEPVRVNWLCQPRAVAGVCIVELGMHVLSIVNAAFNVNGGVRGIYVLGSMQ